MAFPEIEMWSTNELTDELLAELIEASNAYALCEFHDPVNEIYGNMLARTAEFLPQLLQIAVDARHHGEP